MPQERAAAGGEGRLIGRRIGKKLKHDASSHSKHACVALDFRSLTTALSVRKKDHRGCGRQMPFAALWRQGTEHGSRLIIHIQNPLVNSRRRAQFQWGEATER